LYVRPSQPLSTIFNFFKHDKIPTW